jgi:hypothetical protein
LNNSSRIRLATMLFVGGAIAGFAVLSGTRSARAENASADGDEAGFVPIFNGRTLEGWEGDAALWKVEDGKLVGDSPGIKKNEFLATKRPFGDFELRLEFKLREGVGNSGVQFRSKRVAGGGEMEGYQADIGEGYWGSLYDEERRRKTLVAAPPKLSEVLRKGDWNSYSIRAEQDHIVMKINNYTTVDYREPDPEIPRNGIFALQLHSGGRLRIEFRNLRIKELK